MYPRPLWGESSNHSSVSKAAPDLACHPRYMDALAAMQTAVLQASALPDALKPHFSALCPSLLCCHFKDREGNLWIALHFDKPAASVHLTCWETPLFPSNDSRRHRPVHMWARNSSRALNSFNHAMQAGDAVFIPEGWWHQIDSAAGTIAVNLWWRSAYDRLLGSHMDSYYLRRALQSLTSAQKARLLQRPQTFTPAAQQPNGSASQADGGSDGSMQEQRGTEEHRSEQANCSSQQGAKQPAHERQPAEHMPAQHGSSAHWAEAAHDSGLDKHRSAKRLRSERVPSKKETGMAGIQLLTLQPRSPAHADRMQISFKVVRLVRGPLQYDACEEYACFCADSRFSVRHCTGTFVPMHDTEPLRNADMIANHKSATLQVTYQSTLSCMYRLAGRI